MISFHITSIGLHWYSCIFVHDSRPFSWVRFGGCVGIEVICFLWINSCNFGTKGFGIFSWKIGFHQGKTPPLKSPCPTTAVLDSCIWIATTSSDDSETRMYLSNLEKHHEAHVLHVRKCNWRNCRSPARLYPWCEKIKRSQQLTTISLFHLCSIPDLCIHTTATNLRNRPLPIYGTASDRWKNKSFLLKHPRNRSISGFRTWFCRDQVWASTPQNRRRIDPNFCMTTTCKSWWIAAWLLTTVCKTLENKQKASGLHECKKPLWKKSLGAFFDWIIFL